MDTDLAHAMAGWVVAAQPFCDEPLLAAMLFQPAGTARAGLWGMAAGGGMGGLLASRSARKKAQTKAGGLPELAVLALGPTKVYVLEQKAKLGAIQCRGPFYVWRRQDLHVTAEPSGLYGKIFLEDRASGSRFAVESTGKTGSFRRLFDGMLYLLQHPSAC